MSGSENDKHGRDDRTGRGAANPRGYEGRSARPQNASGDRRGDAVSQDDRSARPADGAGRDDRAARAAEGSGRDDRSGRPAGG
ncbi:RNA helicase, partial [Pengzhenrongella frigida]